MANQVDTKLFFVSSHALFFVRDLRGNGSIAIQIPFIEGCLIMLARAKSVLSNDTLTTSTPSSVLSGNLPRKLRENLPQRGSDPQSFVALVRESCGREQARHAARLIAAVTGIYGVDTPDLVIRLRDALTFGRGVSRDLAPEMGFWTALEIPDSTLRVMREEAGFAELLLLHQAGAGTQEGREGLEIIASLLEGFDLHDAMSRPDPVNLTARASYHNLMSPLRRAFEAEFSS